MRLRPFHQVDDTPFDARRADVERTLGPAPKVDYDPVGLTALDYGDVVFRFQDSTGRLEEVTRRAPMLYLVLADGVADVPFGGLAACLRARDGDAFERAGFLVSPRFGLAFVPDEPDWVTALAAHAIAAWRGMGHGNVMLSKV